MKITTAILATVGSIAIGALADGVIVQRHAPDWDLSRPMNGIAFERIKAVAAPKPDRPTPRFLRLKSIRGKKSKYLATSALGRALRSTPTKVKQTFQNISSVGDYPTQYAIQCE